MSTINTTESSIKVEMVVNPFLCYRVKKETFMYFILITDIINYLFDSIFDVILIRMILQNIFFIFS